MHYLAMKSLVLQLAFCVAPLFAASVNKRYSAEKNGVLYNVFEHAATGSRLEFVKDSGICETTPNVTQYSGYLTVGDNMNMFFW